MKTFRDFRENYIQSKSLNDEHGDFISDPESKGYIDINTKPTHAPKK